MNKPNDPAAVNEKMHRFKQLVEELAKEYGIESYVIAYNAQVSEEDGHMVVMDFAGRAELHEPLAAHLYSYLRLAQAIKSGGTTALEVSNGSA